MCNNCINFKHRNGTDLVAHYPLLVNDSYVILELAWAWPNGQKLCGLKRCPSIKGGYCLECHMIAADARSLAELRYI